MRVLLALSIAALSAAHLYLPLEAQHAALQPLPRLVASAEHHLFHKRQLVFTSVPNTLVPPREIELILNERFSNIDLWLNSERVGKTLQRHPFVQEATIRNCWRIDPRCFELTLQERRPEYALVQGVGKRGKGTALLVGPDGGAIAPVAVERLRAEQLALGSERFLRPRVVVGLTEPSSPDSARAGFSWVRDRIELIEQHVGARVVRADVQFGVAMKLRFPHIRGEVLVSEPTQEGDPSIETQAKRLAAVVEQLGDRVQTVTSVDLGFRKQAVLTF